MESKAPKEDPFTVALERSSAEKGVLGVVTADANGLCVGATGDMRFQAAAGHVCEVRRRFANLAGDNDVSVQIETTKSNITIFRKDGFTFGVLSKNQSKAEK
uniref:Uncharacterized protein n=1 Tax=Lotharella globosa TaxID=91324 RepID=A0A6U3EL37_9EUKA|mmetsp:Transcript_13766/g.27853  ORF Transcript_13766/g.27853 Transcript_13766/m.27853 type:complete len:102 (+) Transcript_13766:71-376(+)|eukprot:CAMPEP_0167777004 /NCGR_PEP_ID=MMETSP0111_2-20121227/3444_1 /TAXON_ID=91324 /ORGANISM="Lotharella globosa, Strain CCCM811" /LENGTH=101 /DNA_ID=CAMNT_0007667123 /DNA_START=74 /DNA_END=379 /DNA_ORIENTATION=-